MGLRARAWRLEACESARRETSSGCSPPWSFVYVGERPSVDDDRNGQPSVLWRSKRPGKNPPQGAKTRAPAPQAGGRWVPNAETARRVDVPVEVASPSSGFLFPGGKRGARARPGAPRPKPRQTQNDGEEKPLKKTPSRVTVSLPSMVPGHVLSRQGPGARSFLGSRDAALVFRSCRRKA